MNQTQRQGFLFVVIAVTGYSLLPIFVKNIQASGLPTLDIATWRFTLAMPIFWLVVLARGTPAPAVPLPRFRLMALGCLLTLAAIAAFFGWERLPAGTFTLLFYTYPALVALIMLMLGERLSGQGWFALALTLVGTALTVPDLGVGLSAGDWLGILLAFLDGLFVAVYFIFNSRLLRGHTALARASAWTITGSFLFVLLMALVRPVTWPADISIWAFLLAIAAVSTVMPVFALTVGLNKLGASKAAILSTLEPLLTMILAAIFLNEKMQSVQLIGGALILISVVLLQIPRRIPVDPALMEAAAAGDVTP
jgi:drug/metabolite transporter (DMT)-like permease